MIILTSLATQNQQAAQALSSFYDIKNILELSDLSDLKQLKDKSCFIIDLDEELNKNISPQTFAQKLIENGFAESVQDIYLLSNETIINKSLTVFAHQLSTALAELHARQINVHIASHISYQSTTIIPPDKNKEWEIIGDNEVRWKGEDILKFLDDPQHTFNGVAYVWGEA
jgi:hypothetical protein